VWLATVGLGFGACVFLVAMIILIPLVSESVCFEGHNGHWGSVPSSPDGKVRAEVWDSGRALRLSDTASGKQLAVFRGSCLAFHPDGKTLASEGDRGVELWDAASGRVLATLKGHSSITCLAFSPDGKFLATGSLGDTLWLWDVASGKRAYLEDPWWLGDTSVDYPTYVAFSADGKTLAASVDERIGLWDVASGKNTVTLDSGLHFVAFAPDGALVLFQNNNRTVEVRVLSAARVKVLFTLSVLCGLGAVGLLYRLGTALAGAAARQCEEEVSPAAAA
jgi:WD40 repeat protein